MSTLTSLGHAVLGIDSDEEVVQGLAAEFPQAHLVAADLVAANLTYADVGGQPEVRRPGGPRPYFSYAPALRRIHLLESVWKTASGA